MAIHLEKENERRTLCGRSLLLVYVSRSVRQVTCRHCLRLRNRPR